jgi:hypothetical protein
LSSNVKNLPSYDFNAPDSWGVIFFWTGTAFTACSGSTEASLKVAFSDEEDDASDISISIYLLTLYLEFICSPS